MASHFVFAADLHLQTGAWKSMPKVIGDSYESFAQIIKYCVDTRPLALILGGDVYDSPTPPPDAVRVFLDGVRELHSNHGSILYVVGQHERHPSLPWVEIYPCGFHIPGMKDDMRRLLSHGTVLAGFDNMPPEEMKDALSKLDPSVNVLVLHQACKGAIPGVVDRFDLDPDWVPPTVKLVLLGDIHKPWVHTRELLSDGVRRATKFIYPGSTCMQSLDEQASKHFLDIEVLPGPEFVVKEVPLTTRVFVPFVVSTERSLRSAVDLAKNLPADSLVCVKYDCRVPGVEAQFLAANTKVHYVFRILPSELMGLSVDMSQVSVEKMSLSGCLNALVKPEEDGELHSFLTKLLDAKDPNAELVAAKAEFFREPVAEKP